MPGSVSKLGGPRALIYRDHLLPFSETFILNQADALRSYSPFFAGRRQVAGIDLARHDTVVVNEGGVRGWTREARHLSGHPPRDFVAHLESFSPRLMHAHFGPDGVNALPLQSRLGVPLIVTFHGYDATRGTELRNGLPAWRYGRRRPQLVNRAATLLAVSNRIRESLLALGIPESRIRVHRIGVDLTKFSPTPLAEREPVVLGVGRFVEKKGFEFLIDAMAAVQRASPETELVLIGSGKLQGDLRAAASRKLKSFRIFGPCPPEEITGWMKRARLLAAPSVTDRSGNTEGLPITVVEAVASGLPVVATRHAGIPEAVVDGESGFLVPERDVDTLADRILEVIRDDAGWKAMSAASRTIAEREFDLAAQTKKLEEIYTEVS
jgi:colanic acid/amylovoran biosynthesis glycosyltransferase